MRNRNARTVDFIGVVVNLTALFITLAQIADIVPTAWLVKLVLLVEVALMFMVLWLSYTVHSLRGR